VARDDRDWVSDQILGYIRRDLLGETDPQTASELTVDTPLLEWGVLTSLNTARLLGFLRDELDTDVPPVSITGRHFRTVDAITDLVLSLPATTSRT
jgi:acyl carrier protein